MATRSHRKSKKKKGGAKIDLRFVVLLGLVLGALGGVALLVVVRKHRHDPDIYVDKAESLRVDGDYEMSIKQLEKALYYDQSDVATLRQLAETLWESGPLPATTAAKRTSRVLGIYSRITTLAPDDKDAQKHFLELLYQHGVQLAQIPLLRQLVEKADEFLDKDPENDLALRYRALALVEIIKRQEKTEEAELQRAKYDLDAVAKRFPDDAEVAEHLSMWYAIRAAQSKDTRSPEIVADLQRSAEEALRDFLGRQPGSLSAKLSLARILYLYDKRDEALVLLNELAIDPALQEEPTLATQLATFLIVSQTEATASADGKLTSVGLVRAEEILSRAHEIQPDNLDIMLNLALVKKRVGDETGAIELLELAFAFDKQVPVGMRAMTMHNLQLIAATELANGYLIQAEKVKDAQERGEILDKARGIVSSLAADLRSSAMVDLMEGKIAMLEGNMNQAITKLESANNKFNGTNPEAVFLSAIVLKRIGETGAAAERLQRLAGVLRGERAMRAYRELADIYFTTGELDKAEAIVNRMLEVAPEDQTALLLRSEVLLRKERQSADASQTLGTDTVDIDEAMRIVEPLAESGDRKAKLQLARLYYEKHQLENARRVLASAWEENPDDLAILQQLLRFDVEADDREMALSRIDSVIARNPDNRVLELVREQVKGGSNTIGMLEDVLSESADPFQSSIGLYTLYRHTDRREKALKALEVAARLKPNDPKVLAGRFQEALRDQEWDEAKRVVTQVGELNLDEAQGLFWQGRLEMAQSQFARSASTFGMALNERPLYSDGWRLQGDAFRMAGSLIDAEKAYTQALKVRPDNLAAIFNLFLVHDARGLEKVALRDLEKAREIAPANQRVFRTYLNYLGRVDREQALAMRLKLAREEPKDTTNLRQLAVLYAELGRKEQANLIFNKLLADEGDNIDHVLAAAEFHRSNGEFETGRALLQKFLDEKGEDAIAHEWLLLARYLLSGDLTQPAIAAYRKAIELEDETYKEASRELADWYFNSQYFSMAVPLYANAFGASRTSRLWLRYVETLIYTSNIDQADALLKEYVAESGHDSQSSLLECIIAISRSDYDVADEAVARAVELGPNTPQAYLYRARLNFLRNPLNERQIVVVDLQKALSLDENLMAAREMLIQCYLSSQPPKTEMAIDQLREVVARKPDYAPARVQLAQLYLMMQRTNDLDKLLADSMAVLPKMPVWNQLKAASFVGQKEYTQAAVYYKRAFDLEKSPQNLALLIGVMLEAGEDALAMRLLDQNISEAGNSPQLVAMRSSALNRTGKELEAKVGFRQAIEMTQGKIPLLMAVTREIGRTLEPDVTINMIRPQIEADRSGTLVMFAAQFLSAGGKQFEAVELLESARLRVAKDTPNRVLIMRQLAVTYQELERFAEAVKVFEQLITDNPRDYVAMNNLAYCYTEYLSLPQKAMEYAREAMQIAPDEPVAKSNILDTLGWAQFQAGDLDEAMLALQDSIRSNPTVHNRYHLARVLMAKGRTREARTQLRMVKEEAERVGDEKMLKEAERMLQ